MDRLAQTGVAPGHAGSSRLFISHLEAAVHPPGDGVPQELQLRLIVLDVEHPLRVTGAAADIDPLGPEQGLDAGVVDDHEGDIAVEVGPAGHALGRRGKLPAGVVRNEVGGVLQSGHSVWLRRDAGRDGVILGEPVGVAERGDLLERL